MCNVRVKNEVNRLLLRFKKIIRNIFNALTSDIKFKLGLYKIKHREIDEQEVSDFVSSNSKYWIHGKESNRGKEIWIEGHLAEYGPNYLIRTAVVAKAVQVDSNNSIRVIFNGYQHQWSVAPVIYRSFGIDKFLFIDSEFIFRNVQIERKAYYLAKECWSTLKSGADILTISYGGVFFGDLIYDDIIKNVSGIFTINKIENHYFNFVERAYYLYLQYDTLFKEGHVSDFVATHTAYCEYGLLVRVALKYKVTVYETTDMHLAKFVPENNTLPTYHEGFNRILIQNWNSFSDDNAQTDSRIQYYHEHLKSRLEGKIEQVDVLLAFGDKRTYTSAILRKELDITNEKRLVFIMCHAFSDSPHVGSWQIHNDYYDWLLQTLNVIKGLDNVNWIIKPHPSAALYNEEGEVGKIVREHCNKNMFLTPDDFNTNSLKDCAHAIITVQGTVGIEFTCYGIPTVITGRPFYGGLGFTIEPQTHEEYSEILRNIEKLEKLDPDQIYNARKAYAIFNEQLLVENEIIKVDVLNNVWGYKNGRDINEAYKIINENIKKHNPRDLPVYKRAQLLARAKNL